MTLARARSLATLAGLVLWLVAWLGRPAGLAGPVYTVILAAGTILLLAAAAGWLGGWLYGRLRRLAQARRLRREPATAALAAAALAAAGPVGSAAVLVTGDNDRPGELRAAHSGAGRSGRPGLAVTRATRFEIGSVTKVFTGLILADMVVRGETGLEITLGTLLGLPERAGGSVTLRALATHTSGLPRLVPGLRMTARVLTADPDPYRGIGLARATAALDRYPPGAQGGFRYSNLGYQLLGAALAAAAGISWPDLVRQRICLPLGLTATGVEPDSGTARGHDRAGLPVPYWDSTALPAAGALVSCAADLEAFVRAQLDPDRTGPSWARPSGSAARRTPPASRCGRPALGGCWRRPRPEPWPGTTAAPVGSAPSWPWPTGRAGRPGSRCWPPACTAPPWTSSRAGR